MTGVVVATPAMTDALRVVYARAFEEPPQAVDFFFARMYDPALCLVYLENNAPVSMAMNYPVHLTYDRSLLDCRYIYAVATLPEARGRGYASEILRESERHNAQQGVVYSMLKPASESLFDYYAQRGYSTTFSLSRVALTESDLAGVTPLTPRDADVNCFITTRFDSLIGTDYAFLWQGREFEAVFDGMNLWGERCYLFDEGGLAVASRKDDRLFIKELLVRTGRERAAVAGLHKLIGGNDIVLHEPVGASMFAGGEPFAYGSSRQLTRPDAMPADFSGYMNLIFD